MSCLVVVVVMVVVVVFVVVVMLVALDQRDHQPGASRSRRARHLLSLHARQGRGPLRRLLLLLLGVGLGMGMGGRGQGDFGGGHGLPGFGPEAFAVAVLQRMLVMPGGLALVVGEVVHVLAPVAAGAGPVRRRR